MTRNTLAILACLICTALPAAEPIFPPALRPGDTIAFVAPAGPLNKEKMELARERLLAMGFQVRAADDLYRETGYLAGSDERRAAELNEAFRDKSVAAIFPGTGGYGTTRILDRLDYDAIRDNPKLLVGFSDITALHIAINQHTGLVTFHSPNPMWGLGNEDNLTPFSAHWFWRALLADRYHGSTSGYVITALGDLPATNVLQQEVCKLDRPVTVRAGTAQGRLIGGNLSLVAALMGTQYEIDTRDKILFLEDVGEAPYRVDRMLCGLRLAGKLDQLSGVMLGQFARRQNEDTTDETTTIDQVLDEYFSGLGIPVIKNFPMGHHKCNATLPVGVLCELDADQQTIRVLENPVVIAE